MRILPVLGAVSTALVLGVTARPAAAQRLELIEPGEVWRYRKGTSEASNPIDAWRQPGFVDSGWLSGPTGIGYGDIDDRTVLGDMLGGYVTLYARKTFTLADPAAVVQLMLDVAYDDGFIAYLNGVEVARSQMPAGPPAFDTLATTHEADAPERFDLTAARGLLAAGANVLAMELHNQSPTSSDASLTPRLFAYGQNPVLRGPYLQSQDETSILVAWRTAAPSVGEVAYGQGSLGAVVVEAAATTEHVVRLAGLVPGAAYDYQIGEGGVALAAPGRFRSGRPDRDARFRMVVFGDSGSATIDQWNVARLIEELAPDLILHTGDIIYPAGEAANYDPRFFDPYRRILDRSVLWPSLGNHDWMAASGQPFVDAFHLPGNGDPVMAEHYYSFQYADTRFIALDSDPSPQPGSTQFLWLENQLQLAAGCFKVVFFHHPPYNSGLNHGSDLAIRANLTPLFDRYGVDLVFNGHEHSYERSFPVAGTLVVGAAAEPDYVDPGGVIYVLTGGGGRALYPIGLDYWTAANASRHHVVVLDRAGDTWTLRALEPDGSASGFEFDRATLRRPSCAPPPYTIYRSPNRDDVPLNPLTTSVTPAWSDPDAAPGIYYYQVEPAVQLQATRRGTLADFTW